LKAVRIAFFGKEIDWRKGTGSGSLTHALSRTVGESGHVYTFEYHAMRAETARQEFAQHRLTNVTLTHRDVCAEGFGVQDANGEDLRLTGSIDAVFLDLPEPWKAIPHTTALFKTNQLGRICCFSPCIEQVQKTATALAQYGFTDVQMMTCLERAYSHKQVTMPSVQSVIHAHDVKKGVKRQVSGDIKADGQDDTETLIIAEPASVRALIPETQQTKGHTAFLTFATYLPVDHCPLEPTAEPILAVDQ
jgi:tRNA (adenine57-N1/adenine58-N1)-methyltransferase